MVLILNGLRIYIQLKFILRLYKYSYFFNANTKIIPIIKKTDLF